MKQILTTLLSGVLFLTACGQALAGEPTAILVSTTETSTPQSFTSTPLPTRTPRERANQPTSTPLPPTPLPTIPTFTPTFDASTIVTSTPAPEAKCPEIDSVIKVENYLPEKLEYPSPDTTDKLLDFLNAGGDGQALIAKLERIYPFGGDFRGGYDFYDVTGDQRPEFIYVEINYEGKLLIFSCKEGNYELLATLPEENDFFDYRMIQIVDLSMNGVPEIIVMGTGGVSFPISKIYLYEWHGTRFSNLGQVSILALRQTQINDVDRNGTNEILFIGDNPGCLSCKNFIPQRQRTIAYGWNGKEFAEILSEFEFPEYRFQAIQDGDGLAIIGRYDMAIHLYEEAISNKELEWWSFERLEYEQALSDSWIPNLILPPNASEDKAEYPHLAAYAYYRIMLIHLVQGNELEAETTYNTLHEKFSSDQSAQPYLEMATKFWEAHQSTHKMYDGCAAAIQYAVEHPEILAPLGSDYHGWQSHTYVPADVCPFR